MSLDVKELSAIEIKGNSFLVSKNSINAVTQNTSVRINKSSGINIMGHYLNNANKKVKLNW